MCIVCVSKWLSEASFKSCGHNTIFNLDVEFVCYIVTSYWIVSLDSWSVYINLSFIEVIRNTYWLDVILVVSVELSCIKPYLVDQFSATFNSLSIQVFCFVVVSLICVWIFIGISVLVCQLRIIIKKLVISNWELSCIQYILLWLELRLFWWSHSVVKLCIWSVCHCLHKCFRFSIVFNFYCDFSLHGIVSDCSVRSFNFFYSVLMSSNLSLSEFKFSEFHLTIFIVLNCFDFSTFRVFQYEAELTSFQLTAFEFLSEVEFDFNWNWVDTFFSWFFWFFNFLRRWVVVVYNLRCCIFDVYSTFNVCFNSGWDIEFIVATKLEFSCVDDLCIVCVSKWLGEASFKSCGHDTIFNLYVELISHISTSYRVICLDSWSIYIKFSFIVIICDSNSLDIILIVFVKLSCIQPNLVNDFITFMNSQCVDVMFFVIVISINIRVVVCLCYWIS